MFIFDWFHTFCFLFVLLLAIPILGNYIAALFEGRKTIFHFLLEWLEKLSYKIAGVNTKEEMTWKTYLKAMFLFNLCGFALIFTLQVAQAHLPFNPQNLPNVPWLLALNTAISFTTNTDWQAYAGKQL